MGMVRGRNKGGMVEKGALGWRCTLRVAGARVSVCARCAWWQERSLLSAAAQTSSLAKQLAPAQRHRLVLKLRRKRDDKAAWAVLGFVVDNRASVEAGPIRIAVPARPRNPYAQTNELAAVGSISSAFDGHDLQVLRHLG